MDSMGSNISYQPHTEAEAGGGGMHDDATADKDGGLAQRRGPSVDPRLRNGLIGAIITIMAVIMIVLAAARMSRPSDDDCSSNPAFASYVSESAQAARRARLQSAVDPERMRAFSAEFSRKPHIAGSARNNELAAASAQAFLDMGFDDVRTQTMPVLLARLVSRSLNLTDATGARVLYTASLAEDNVVGQEDWYKALPPSNGYSGSGAAAGPVVWANYCQDSDFATLGRLGVDLRGTIVVCRYGQIFRGNKAKLAQSRGAVGVIITQDAATVGSGRGPVFPNGPWASNVTVQRGSVYTGEGYPLTPSWPSQFGGPTLGMGDLFDAVKMEDNPLPGIPVQPIGYGDCARLLQQGLAGTTPLPAGWGADTGFAALLAGGIGPSTTTLVKMEVRRELEVFNITNVMASIYGGVEPDRAILYGSHQDAWTYGALDPISGASVVQEISRVLGGWHKNEGWVPRRTIQACRWDAEEWAIIGSNEFVETNLELLRQRGVAYLNVDVAVSGTSNLGAELSPLLRGVFEAAARDVPNPNRTIGGSLFTLLDGQVSSPGSGSDHVGFIQLAGVPVIDAGIGSKRNVYEAVYHSNYDSMAWIQMIDPTFGFHAAMAKLYGNIILRLSEPAVLPLVPVDYAKAVDGWVNDFVAADTQRVADWSFMRGAVASFNASAARHANRVAALQQQLVVAPHAVSPYDVRAVNDINMGVERVFIANGKKETGQHFYKHVLFTPSAVNSYGSSVMPLITLGLATQNRSDANFAIGRVAQFVFRASAFVNSSSVMPPNF